MAPPSNTLAWQRLCMCIVGTGLAPSLFGALRRLRLQYTYTSCAGSYIVGTGLAQSSFGAFCRGLGLRIWEMQ